MSIDGQVVILMGGARMAGGALSGWRLGKRAPGGRQLRQQVRGRPDREYRSVEFQQPRRDLSYCRHSVLDSGLAVLATECEARSHRACACTLTTPPYKQYLKAHHT